MTISHACVLFTGFLQKQAVGAGFVELAHRVHELVFASPRPGWRVYLYPWNTDVADIAEALWQFRPLDKPQIQIVAGYSYGGDAAVRYCWELEQRGGVEVRQLALCDAVRRWRFLPGVAAALPWPKLRLPDVPTFWFRRHGRFRWDWPPFDPAGHDVVGAKVEMEVKVTAGHLWIDNNRLFHNRVLRHVEELIRESEQCAA